MNFADTVRYLYAPGHELKTGKWDLATMQTLLAALGHPESRGRFIHVAGTNGKGSTCAMMAQALRVSGRRTGLYTSPHLMSPRERIQIDGRWIDETEWCTVFEEVHATAEKLLASEQIPVYPSFFESLTAMAFCAFARARVEITVLETGLGGRLDATNVVTPEVSVIAPIDFDHEAFLGSSIESIAAEKAGILKPERPAVLSAQRPEALRVLEHRAVQLDIPLHHSAAWRIEDLHLDRYGSRFTLYADEALEIVCPLAGAHQVENARTAVTALTVAGISRISIQEGIAQTRWPGRLEHVGRDPDIIFDGAHNPAGARALAQYIRQFFRDEPIRIVFGSMRDKAVEEVTEILFPLAAEVIVTAPDQPRALNPKALAEMCGHPNMKIAMRLRDALVLAERQPMTTFITGSLYLVGEAQELYGTQALHGHVG